MQTTLPAAFPFCLLPLTFSFPIEPRPYRQALTLFFTPPLIDHSNPLPTPSTLDLRPCSTIRHSLSFTRRFRFDPTIAQRSTTYIPYSTNTRLTRTTYIKTHYNPFPSTQRNITPRLSQCSDSLEYPSSHSFSPLRHLPAPTPTPDQRDVMATD